MVLCLRAVNLPVDSFIELEFAIKAMHLGCIAVILCESVRNSPYLARKQWYGFAKTPSHFIARDCP